MRVDTKTIFDTDFMRRGRDLEWLMIHLLKGGLDKQARDQFGLTEAKVVQQLTTADLGHPKDFALRAQDEQWLAAIQKHGYSFIENVFSPEELAAARSYLESQTFTASTDGEGHGPQMRIGEITPDISFGHYTSEQVCACPQIYRVLHDVNLHRLVSRYLGAPATAGIVSSWWSFPVAGSPVGMQMYHHDRGDFRSCNLFVYLTDVDEGSGPHAFVEGTHTMATLLPYASARFNNSPNKFRKFWDWMEDLRKTDEQVHMLFAPELIKSHTGPAGTSFLEDTRGLHKGTKPETKPRLVFEIFYSLIPKFGVERSQIDRRSLPFADKTENLDPLVRYATRLYYK